MQNPTNEKKEENMVSLVQRYLETATQDMEQWLEILHEDVVIEFPFAKSAGLSERITGKEFIKTSTQSFLSSVPGIRFNNPVIYPSADANQAFATYDVEVLVPSTNRIYKQTYISEFIQKDGKIIKMAEYYDPTKIVEAFTGL